MTSEAPTLLLTTQEVAETLAIAPRTVYRLRDCGQLRAVRVGKRLVRFAAEDVQAFVERGRRRDELLDPRPYPPVVESELEHVEIRDGREYRVKVLETPRRARMVQCRT
jgi:excisionase family DNA binding protein